MKKFLVGILLATFAVLAQAHSAIIRGESSPGVYVTIKTDATGNLYVAPASGATSTVAYTQTTPTITNSNGTVLAANTSRKYVSIQNNDAAGIVYINFGAAATTAHFKIIAGATLILDNFVPNGTITAIGSIASNANISVVEGQ